MITPIGEKIIRKFGPLIDTLLASVSPTATADKPLACAAAMVGAADLAGVPISTLADSSNRSASVRTGRRLACWACVDLVGMSPSDASHELCIARTSVGGNVRLMRHQLESGCNVFTATGEVSAIKAAQHVIAAINRNAQPSPTWKRGGAA